MSELHGLPASIQYIIKGLKVDVNRSPQALARLVREANVQEKELFPWADWEHPVADSYGRKLVYADAGFEIMVMSWQPGDFSAIHDHGYAQWGAVQIFGAAEHATFRIHAEELQTTARWRVKPGTVLPVDHDLIHQMGNSSAESFLSLHIYGEEEDCASITADARIFDPIAAEIMRVDGGVFFALPEEYIVRTEAGYKGDAITSLRFLVEDIRRKMQLTAFRLGTARNELEKEIERFFCLYDRIENGLERAGYIDSTGSSGYTLDVLAAEQLAHELIAKGWRSAIALEC